MASSDNTTITKTSSRNSDNNNNNNENDDADDEDENNNDEFVEALNATSVKDRVDVFGKLLNQAGDDSAALLRLISLLDNWFATYLSEAKKSDDDDDSCPFAACFESLYTTVLFNTAQDDVQTEALRDAALSLRRKTSDSVTYDSVNSALTTRALDELPVPFSIKFVLLTPGAVPYDRVLERLDTAYASKQQSLSPPDAELCTLLLSAGKRAAGVHSLVRLGRTRIMRRALIEHIAQRYATHSDGEASTDAYDALAELCVNGKQRTAATLALALLGDVPGGVQAGLSACVVLLRRGESANIACSPKCTAALSLIQSFARV